MNTILPIAVQQRRVRLHRALNALITAIEEEAIHNPQACLAATWTIEHLKTELLEVPHLNPCPEEAR
jgi:hypothetical protein